MCNIDLTSGADVEAVTSIPLTNTTVAHLRDLLGKTIDMLDQDITTASHLPIRSQQRLDFSAVG